jgi:hypothetical protein
VIAVRRPVTVNDLLDGHVALDIECMDRLYLNAYVPNLQVGGQIVTFLTLCLPKISSGQFSAVVLDPVAWSSRQVRGFDRGAGVTAAG